jgi:hypothetical protein
LIAFHESKTSSIVLQCPTRCTEGTAAAFGHSNHDERLHSGRERYEKTGGGKGPEYSAGEEENGVETQWVRMGTYDFQEFLVIRWNKWYAWQDSNLRPFAPEANALSI